MKLALKDVLLELPGFALSVNRETACSRLGIIRPSGAGKTTLLEVLCGLRKPARGSICLAGEILHDSAQGLHTPAHRRGIGYVPQDLALFPHLSVEKNLRYGFHAERAGTPFQFEAVTKVFEIEGLLGRGIAGLSGGERQRVALARALLAGPRLLALDEPMSSLDSNLKTRVIHCLQMAQREFSLPTIVVTHDREEARALCEQVWIMGSGEIVEERLSEEI